MPFFFAFFLSFLSQAALLLGLSFSAFLPLWSSPLILRPALVFPLKTRPLWLGWHIQFTSGSFFMAG